MITPTQALIALAFVIVAGLAWSLGRSQGRKDKGFVSPKMQAMADALDACRADCAALEKELKRERNSKAQISGANNRLLGQLFYQNRLTSKDLVKP